MRQSLLRLSFLISFGACIAQAPTAPAARAVHPNRSDVDAVIAQLRSFAKDAPVPALGGDSVYATGKILCAMANCHRRYHISDGPVVRPSVEFLVAQQAADGSFGDAAATAWASAGLSAIDPEGSAQVAARGRSWLAKRTGEGDPFAALVATLRAKDPQGTTPPAEVAVALQAVKAWLAAPTGQYAKIADGLLVLVAYQVACRAEEPKVAAKVVAATFSPAQQRGLDWLLTQQKDGLFLAGGKRSEALTGFGLMALQSKPAGLRTAREQAAIDQGLHWLLQAQGADGTWGDSLQNYTTCVAVGALSRWQDAAVAPALAKAQRALLAFQHCEADGYQRSDRDYGSVGYGGSQRGDLSNLHFALQALRQTGLPSSDEAFARAVVFLQRTQNLTPTNDFAGKVPDPERADIMLDVTSGDDGGACYYPGNSSAGYVVRADGKAVPRSYGSMTYALLKAYALAGLPSSDPRLRAAVAWIQDHWELAVNPGVDPALGEKAQYQGLFYYYLLMAQALDQLGVATVAVHRGDQTTEIAWGTALRAQLEGMQRADGTWQNEQNGRWMEKEPLLCTCYALLALEHCR